MGGKNEVKGRKMGMKKKSKEELRWKERNSGEKRKNLDPRGRKMAGIVRI
jgi:hypothetical protein